MFLEVDNDNLIAKTAALATEIWTEHYLPIIGPEQVSYMLAKFQSPAAIASQIRQGYRYFLIEDEMAAITGYFAVRIDSNGMFLSKFYVKRSCRGKGLGRQAFAFIEKLATDNGLGLIWLTVNKNNTASIKIYKKLGFIIADKVVTDIGNGYVMDDYKMEKQLDPA
ncbi:MAG: GNAT family N-acetyltransferase [Sedimentisphaerales bacterium]|nr:GNAT family N-acetyltransferase [Sedimentisphaerales bacterium]